MKVGFPKSAEKGTIQGEGQEGSPNLAVKNNKLFSLIRTVQHLDIIKVLFIHQLMHQ